MEFKFDELNAGKFHWNDELNSDPKKFLSDEMHSAKKRADGKGYDFGLDDELRTDLADFDEQKIETQISDYFEPMGISEEQKNFRKKKAKECFDDFMFMLYWIDTLRGHAESLKWDSIISECVKRLLKTFGNTIDTTVKDIIKIDSVDAMDVTERHPNEPYYVSPDRAVNLGLEVTSDVANYLDYDEAVKNGKTKKTWYTVLDGRERISHNLMAGRTVPIDDLFVVGDSFMKFPRDLDYDPSLEEVCNCRCWCVYK